jgi:hypothetical protein
MTSAQLVAALTGFAGLCLLAGWISAFRNRAYVAWLGLAFVALSASLFSAGAARDARELGRDAGYLSALAQFLLGACIVSFLIALVVAVQETRRRLREMREAHEASVEAMLEMMRSRREREEGDEARAQDVGTEDDEP